MLSYNCLQCVPVAFVRVSPFDKTLWHISASYQGPVVRRPAEARHLGFVALEGSRPVMRQNCPTSAGSSAGIIGVTGVGFIVERTGSYTLVFQLTTGTSPSRTACCSS